MKSNVIYVDFAHKKISNKKTMFTFEEVKSFIKNIFSNSNYNNSSRDCKRILKRKNL